MKRWCNIELARKGRAGQLWTVRFDGAAESEFERVLREQLRHPVFQELKTKLSRHLDQIGFEGQALKPEHPSGIGSKECPPVKAVYWQKGARCGIRLLGIHWSMRLFIAGGGGAKTTKTLQENSTRYAEACMLAGLGDKILERVREGRLQIGEDGSLNGQIDDLRFEV